MIAADDAGKHVSKTLQNKYEKLEDAPAEKSICYWLATNSRGRTGLIPPSLIFLPPGLFFFLILLQIWVRFGTKVKTSTSFLKASHIPAIVNVTKEIERSLSIAICPPLQKCKYILISKKKKISYKECGIKNKKIWRLETETCKRKLSISWNATPTLGMFPPPPPQSIRINPQSLEGYILQKYTLEMDVWKLLVKAFRKYNTSRGSQLLCNGQETPTNASKKSNVNQETKIYY